MILFCDKSRNITCLKQTTISVARHQARRQPCRLENRVLHCQIYLMFNISFWKFNLFLKKVAMIVIHATRLTMINSSTKWLIVLHKLCLKFRSCGNMLCLKFIEYYIRFRPCSNMLCLKFIEYYYQIQIMWKYDKQRWLSYLIQHCQWCHDPGSRL